MADEPQTLITKEDDDDEDDIESRFLYNFEMADDQQAAISELYQLKLDLGFLTGIHSPINFKMIGKYQQFIAIVGIARESYP